MSDDESAATTTAGSNAPTKSTSGRTLTLQQRQFVETTFAKSDIVLVRAVAGSGKTTTLEEYARKHPQLRILYIVYNKAASAHAERIMPSNTHPRTFHSLALEIVQLARKVRNQPLVTRPESFIRLPDFEKLACQGDDMPPEHRQFFEMKGASRWALDLFLVYLGDSQRDITPQYVDTLMGQQQRMRQRSREQCVASLHYALKMAWRHTLNALMPITFDGCTKFMFINQPKLEGRYDLVLVDEAQDFRQQFLDTTMGWRNAIPLVFVGDPCQRIYGWQGTADAFATVQPTRLFGLSESFRFGPPVAQLALKLTGPGFEITGTSRHPCSILVRHVQTMLPPTLAFGHPEVAYLHRSNVGLLLHACELARASKVTRLSVIGRGAEILKDVEAQIEMATSKRWQFDMRLKEAIESGDDNQKRLLEWIQKDPRQVSMIVNELRDRIVRQGSRSDAILGTVHASKGLEFSCVVLSDDLLPETSREYKLQQLAKRPFGRKRPAALLDDEPEEETTDSEDTEENPELRSTHPPIGDEESLRLLYVAVTRAQHKLVLSPLLDRAIRKRHRALAGTGAGSTATTTSSIADLFKRASTDKSVATTTTA